MSITGTGTRNDHRAEEYDPDVHFNYKSIGAVWRAILGIKYEGTMDLYVLPSRCKTCTMNQLKQVEVTPAIVNTKLHAYMDKRDRPRIYAHHTSAKEYKVKHLKSFIKWFLKDIADNQL